MENKKREYTVILTDSEAISMKDFAEDRTGNYNPYDDFKIMAKQVKAQIDANFEDYQHLKDYPQSQTDDAEISTLNESQQDQYYSSSIQRHS